MMTIRPTFTLTAIAIAIASSLMLTGCNTVKGLTKKNDDIIATAEKGEADYYSDAQRALAKEHYKEAISALNNIRTFYPTGQYTQQALLDLIYAQYQAKNYEAVLTHTAEFTRSYPTSRYADYALYVQGVTNMGGAPQSSRLFNLDQSQRDISYLRLAFNDFSSLLTHFPDSIYAPDAAQRMLAIYNDFAEHELVAARWYIKRGAYVAAANRAKWVFQYFPQSQGVPEATAILAYSYNKLGMNETADQYKTLLQINYPQYLRADGSVRIDDSNTLGFGKKALSSMTFGRFGQAKDDSTSYASDYNGSTYTPTIHQVSQLSLPKVEIPGEATSTTPPNRRIIGLGLPADEAGATGSMPEQP